MADEADPGNVLADKNVGFRAAYRPGPRKAQWQFGSTESARFCKCMGQKSTGKQLEPLNATRTAKSN